MSETSKGGVVRFNYNDEADLKELIANGIIWRSGARAWHAAITLLRADPSLINDTTPPAVVEFLSAGPAPAEPTLPGEEPEVAPEAVEPVPGQPDPAAQAPEVAGEPLP